MAPGSWHGQSALQRKLAWRFFSGGRSQALVSMISTISLAGMVIAVALLVLVLSVMNGFEREFRDRILGLVPHATLWLRPHADVGQLQKKLQASGGVTQAIPFVEFKALAVRAASAEPVLVQGIDYSEFSSIAGEFVQAGNGEKLQKLAAGEIVLGARLAEKLGIAPGERLRLMHMRESTATESGNGGANVSAVMQRAAVHSVVLAGVLNTGSELDQRIALLPVADAAAIAGRPGQYDGIQLQFADVFSAPVRVEQLAAGLEPVTHYSDWTRAYGNLYTAIQLSRQIVVLLLASIVAIAAFNIFVTLGMVVRHKRYDIAILRSMGLDQSQVLRVFIWQGMWVAIPGAALGMLLGIALAWLAPALVNLVQAQLGKSLLSTEIYPIDYLPAEVRLGDLALIAVVALVMSFLATMLPARQAARLPPASVLNGKGR